MVVFDNSFLSLLLHPDADVPNDPATDAPVERAHDRIAYLVERLRESGTRILIPAPVLGEFLTVADATYLPSRETGLEAFHVADLPLPPQKDPTLPFGTLVEPSSGSIRQLPRSEPSSDEDEEE